MRKKLLNQNIVAALIFAATAALFTPPEAAQAQTVAHWKLDDASGQLIDSVGAYHLSAPGGATYLQPALTNAGTAVNFSGCSTAAAARIDSPVFHMTANTSFTFEGFFQAGDQTGDTGINGVVGGTRHGEDPARWKGWTTWMRDEGKLSVYINGSGGAVDVRSVNRYDDNQPHHFAVVWDHDGGSTTGGKVSLYVDYELVGEGDDVTNQIHPGTPMTIGQRFTDYGGHLDPFPGTLDELRFSSEALVSSEFLGAPSGESSSGLITYEPFDYTPPGEELTVSSGGLWTNNGFDPHLGKISSGTLAYPGEFSPSSTGNAADAQGVGGNQRSLDLQLSTEFGDSEGAVTRWISVLVQPGQIGGFCGIGLWHDPASEGSDMMLGYGGGASTPSGRGWTFGKYGGGGTGGISPVEPVSSQTTLLVGKMVFTGDSNPDTLRLFLNPGSAEPADSEAVAVHTGIDYGTIKKISMGWNYPALIDEIRIGKSYSDISNLITYEPFDYTPPGEELTVSSGGLWTNNGFDPHLGKISSGTLAYPGEFSPSSTGNAADAQGVGGNQRSLDLQLSTELGDSEGAVTRWISVLMQPGQIGGFCGIGLWHDPASEGSDMMLGYGGGASTPSGRGWTFGNYGGGGTGGISPVEPVSSQTTLLVGKMEFTGDSNPDTLRLFLNPGSAEPADTEAVAVHTGIDYGTIKKISMGWNYPALIDEIRIGKSFSDIAGLAVGGAATEGEVLPSVEVHTQSKSEDWYQTFLMTWGQINYQNRYRGQVKFDLSGVVSGSTVTSASLVLNTEADSPTGNANVIVERLTSVAPPLFSATVGTEQSLTPIAAPGEYSWDVTEIVQAWVDGSPNYGFRLRPENEANSPQVGFQKDGLDAPSLIIVTE